MPEELPAIPAAQNVQVSPFTMPFQPVTLDQFLGFNQQMFEQQLEQRHDVYARTYQDIDKYGAMWEQQALDLDKQFMPQYAELYTGLMEQANPQFMGVYNALGGRVMEGLEAGYSLGAPLSREIEQAIRAAQTSRGNWLGPAPTAQEAFGKGEAAISLYNQRLGQAQGFLSGRQPSEFWGQLQGASKYGIWDMGPSGAAANSALNPSIAPNVYGTFAGSQSAYNATAANAYGSYVSGLIGAADVNNTSAFNRYSAQMDQFMYQDALSRGLMTQPSMGGGGMGGSPWMGAALGGIGTGVASGIGIAAAGGGTMAALGGGAAAAVGAAAAAICSLARLAIPGQWKAWRRWLFTRAPETFRRRYIFGHRKAALRMTRGELERVGQIMRQVISFSETQSA